MMSLTRAVLPLILLLPGWSVADATVESAFEKAAAESGIPRVVLHAVACAESGRHADKGVKGPWPWTLNIAGQLRHYGSRKAAEAALEEALALGITNIGIGLMQINWRLYHGRFEGPSHALDPGHNLRVGARLLSAEWRPSGDLWVAIGRFHSLSASEASTFRRHVGADVVRLLSQRTSHDTVSAHAVMHNG